MGQQIIGGQTYEQYTPAWYAAMDAQKVHDAGVAGQATGTGEGTAIAAKNKVVGPPDVNNPSNPLPPSLMALMNAVGGGGALSGSGSTTIPGASGGAVSLALPASPGMTGLSAAAGGARPSVAPVQPIDTTASARASFAKAKDQVGQTSEGALTALRSSLGGRGMLGSGAESRGTASVINQGQEQLGDVSRQQAVTDASLGADAAKTNFEGAVSERGQDVSAEASALNAATAQRGQNIQAMEAANSLQVQQAELQAQQRNVALQGLVSALNASARSY